MILNAVQATVMLAHLPMEPLQCAGLTQHLLERGLTEEDDALRCDQRQLAIEPKLFTRR